MSIWLYAGKPENPSGTRPNLRWVGSDNPDGADNQQERLVRIGWVVGFVDGEGCFSIGFVRQAGGASRKGYGLGYQVFHEFVVVQGARSRAALNRLRDHFGAGQVAINRRFDDHREDMYRFVVRKRADLLERVIPFFEQHPLQTSKQNDFECFARCVRLMARGRHLDRIGMIEIAEISEQMNRRKSKADLIRILRDHTPDTPADAG
jgi:hypothetical protein